MMNANLRVVMVTVIPQAARLIEGLVTARGHRVVGILTAPGPRTRRTEDYREVAQLARPGLDVIVSNHPNRWAEMVRAMKPDLIISLGFNWKIPVEVLEVPRLGAINAHDGLLPRYRGLNATGWQLRNDEREIGYSVHYMNWEFDSGPVLSQFTIPISDDILSVADLHRLRAERAPEQWNRALARVEAGDPGDPQDEALALYSPGKFESEWREIDWSEPARRTFIRVRSWHGARDVPRGAFGEIDGQRCLVNVTRLTGQQSNHSAPGAILERREDGTLLIQCGDGTLEVLEWEHVSERTG